VLDLQPLIGRLVYLVRSVAMKRALTEINPDPPQNFWRLIYGNQLDVAVLEWCKVFGSHAEETHWKSYVPKDQHAEVKAELLEDLGITEDQWNAYWEEMKAYRDTAVAHHVADLMSGNYPKLDHALKSALLLYKRVIAIPEGQGAGKPPKDLAAYYEEFLSRCKEVAKLALEATSHLPEPENKQ
jgi:hypothetical protein